MGAMTPPAVVLMTKPAIPGRVKTRLTRPAVGSLTAQQAAELHAAFVFDTGVALDRSAAAVWVAWALDANDGVRQPPPVELLPRPLFDAPTLEQTGRGLGERLFHALSSVGQKHPLVAAVGSDHPTLASERIDEAFEMLGARGVDAVFGPADDGGFYLVALAAEDLAPELFRGIPWSSARTLASLRTVFEGAGLCSRLLAPLGDVDEPADLERLCETLTHDPGLVCEATRKVLKRWGRIP